ncbi:sodium channel subunit beta-4 isoform X1 [Symphalangus syndactylus]
MRRKPEGARGRSGTRGRSVVRRPGCRAQEGTAGPAPSPSRPRARAVGLARNPSPGCLLPLTFPPWLRPRAPAAAKLQAPRRSPPPQCSPAPGRLPAVPRVPFGGQRASDSAGPARFSPNVSFCLSAPGDQGGASRAGEREAPGRRPGTAAAAFLFFTLRDPALPPPRPPSPSVLKTWREARTVLGEFPCTQKGARPARPGVGAAGALPGTASPGLFLIPVTLSLEVSVGKATNIYAVNGTEILLPCTFSSCFGFEDLHFRWTYNSSDAFKILIEGTVKNEKSDPKVTLKDDDRIALVGSTKEKMNNISIVLRDLEFSDTGKYTCHVKNPKENNLQHHATIFLQVVDRLEEVDNTVTLIILAVVGGVIGLLILILLIKKLIIFILKKTREKKKECLVSSSGNDNTENGLPGSKAEEKPPSKV